MLFVYPYPVFFFAYKMVCYIGLYIYRTLLYTFHIASLFHYEKNNFIQMVNRVIFLTDFFIML